MFLDVLNKHAPVDSIKIKGNNLPYITSEVRQMARQRDFLRKKAYQTGSKYLRQAFQHIKKKVTYKVRKLRSEYYLKKIKENEGDLKGTWKILKQVMNKGNDQANIQKLLYNGQEINDKQEISENFNDYFIGIGEELATGIQPSDTSSSDYLSNIEINRDNKFKFKPLKPTEVFKILSKLKNGKATGLHMISNSVLKGAKDIIAPSMADIFNASIEKKIFPDDFKTARVTPIFKCGNKEDLGNYRLISIISSIARVFEKLLYQQLHEFLSRRKILNMHQWGFRSLHSTALALIACIDQFYSIP